MGNGVEETLFRARWMSIVLEETDENQIRVEREFNQANKNTSTTLSCMVPVLEQ